MGWHNYIFYGIHAIWEVIEWLTYLFLKRIQRFLIPSQTVIQVVLSNEFLLSNVEESPLFGEYSVLQNVEADMLDSVLLVPDKRAFIITSGASDISGCAQTIVIADVTFAKKGGETTFIHNLDDRASSINCLKDGLNGWNSSSMFFPCNRVNYICTAKAGKVCCTYRTGNVILTIGVI